MVLPQNFDQVLLINVGVTLGGGNGCVPQKLLYHSDIRAVAQQQRRYCMPQHVRSYMPLNLGLSAQLRDDISDSLGREPSIRGVQEKSRVLCFNSCSGL